jgi:hypothetical protein
VIIGKGKGGKKKQRSGLDWIASLKESWFGRNKTSKSYINIDNLGLPVNDVYASSGVSSNVSSHGIVR